MLGAIAGDMISSAIRRRGPPPVDSLTLTAASRFTGGTVLTVATAHALMTGVPYADAFRELAGRCPRAGYGPAFRRWLTGSGPGTSRGSGAARRVVPVGLALPSLEQTLVEARRCAQPTHAHPEGVRGAQAVAMAVFLARSGSTKQVIREQVTARFGYDLSRTLTVTRPAHRFDASCDVAVSEALGAFLTSDGVEGAIRLAASVGGDADARASIAGGVAEAFFGVMPSWLALGTFERLPPVLQAVVREFLIRFALPAASALSRE